LDELSEKVEPFINEALEDYGLKCIKFSLSGLDVDTTKYDMLDTSQMELIARQRGYQGDKAGLDILGADWTRVQGVNVLKDIANNPGAGGVAAAGAGMGMGIGAAGVFGSIAQQVFAPVNNGFPTQPPIQQQPSGRFTQQQSTSGSKQSTQEDPLEVLAKLKKMLDAGLIEQAEYDAKKADVLSRM
jgi:membrane protease subunit (stomatin/prohibitin family)